MKKHLLLFIIPLLFGCSPKQADITYVEESDPAMRAAITKAKDTVSEFWTRRNQDGDRFMGLLKVYFEAADEDGEHMWVQIAGRKENKASGILLSSPRNKKLPKQGSLVTFSDEDITDWLYVDEGIARGAHTVYLLRSRMNDDERRSHDSNYPFRFE